MRWAGVAVQRTKSFAMAAGLLIGAGALQGCIVMKPDDAHFIPDAEITAQEFDDTIAFYSEIDADAAEPPLPVHELDESKLAAEGGKKVVDGKVWLDADGLARNDILNTVAEAMPADTMLVIVVATGAVWQVPLTADGLLPDGVAPWSGEDLFALDERASGPPRIEAGLTRPDFDAMTAVANMQSLGQLYLLHVFGAAGYSEIAGRGGQQVALAATWARETPAQRTLRMVMLWNYFSRLPQFKGSAPAFAVMVPDGGLYLMAEIAYRAMMRQAALRMWTSAQIFQLPVTALLLDRAIKNTRILIGPKEP